jgi:DNA-binding NtrC family response regulator
MVSAKSGVLVVDDESAVAQAHAALLSELGYEPIVETNPRQVESRLGEHPEIRVVLLDIRMPGVSGMEVLRRVRMARPHVGVVMATVVNDIEQAVMATKCGAYNYLLKPLQTERLKGVLESVLANQPNQILGDPRFSGFITGYRPLERLFNSVRSFAAAEVTVLIQGETGTGKELIAGMLHSFSSRMNKRFLAVNLAAVTPALFESEIFGHRRGAFTGSVSDHAGFLEEAQDGTLFLDEVGELSLDLQAKLLRVLQTRTFCRVGDPQERSLAASIVLATNRNLREEVRENRFRADLFYRVAGHIIDLPALRERTGDITVLSRYFLHKYTSQFGRMIDDFHPEALQILENYEFPGNVRELEGIISGSVLLETSSVITPSSLPAHVRMPVDSSGNDLESIRHRAILAALAGCNGNQTLAARKLGISRGALNRLLNKHRERESKT